MISATFTDRLSLHAMICAQKQIEFAINAACSGDRRNTLCDINIMLLDLIVNSAQIVSKPDEERLNISHLETLREIRRVTNENS